MIRTLALAAFALSALPAAAQQPAAPRNFAQLQQAFAEKLKAARGAENRRQAEQAAFEAQAKELQSYLEHEAKTDEDRCNARLLLVDTFRILGAKEKAKSALAGLDPANTPVMGIVAAAQFAAELGMQPQRKAWIDAAIAKPAPFEERMALAMHLMSGLREVGLGEKILQDAFGAAKDDEERAKVRWFEAAALREREDRADDAYDKALEALAKEFPATLWGGIAKDRVAASQYAVGQPAVPLSIKTTDGRTIETAKLAGKVVILDFWASWSEHAPAVERFLLDLHGKYAEQGLVVIGISLDEVRAEFDGFVKQHKLPWAQEWDGHGNQCRTALRCNVDDVPNLLVLDRQGRIAGQNLLPTGPDDQKQIEQLVKAALAKQG